MVWAIRFWVQVTDVAKPSADGGYRITPFGQLLLGWSIRSFFGYPNLGNRIGRITPAVAH